MPILYTCIARGTQVLVKYASCAGNFTQVTDLLLAKIAPHDDKLTYLHGNYLFHYISSDSIIYLCITDDVSISYFPFLDILWNLVNRNAVCQESISLSKKFS